jgi:hypothetical protein
VEFSACHGTCASIDHSTCSRKARILALADSPARHGGVPGMSTHATPLFRAGLLSESATSLWQWRAMFHEIWTPANTCLKTRPAEVLPQAWGSAREPAGSARATQDPRVARPGQGDASRVNSAPARSAAQ